MLIIRLGTGQVNLKPELKYLTTLLDLKFNYLTWPDLKLY